MSDKVKDWSVFLNDPDVVLTCLNCKKYRTYTNYRTGYRYRWCKYCMEEHVMGPYKHTRSGTYTPERYQRQRRREGLTYKLMED